MTFARTVGNFGWSTKIANPGSETDLAVQLLRHTYLSSCWDMITLLLAETGCMHLHLRAYCASNHGHSLSTTRSRATSRTCGYHCDVDRFRMTFKMPISFWPSSGPGFCRGAPKRRNRSAPIIYLKPHLHVLSRNLPRTWRGDKPCVDES